MIKYRVFFLNSGSIYDAYKNEVLPVEIQEDSISLVEERLEHLIQEDSVSLVEQRLKRLDKDHDKFCKDLTFVILPVLVFDSQYE